MNVEQDELFALLGRKDVEIYLLRKQIVQLQQAVADMREMSEAENAAPEAVDD